MKRGCEDCFFGVIFFIICLAFTFCYVYVLIVGDSRVLTKNFDCFGNICGEQRNLYDSASNVNMTHRSFLLHTSFLSAHNSIGVCVRQCPNATLESLNDLAEYIQRTENYLCDCRVPRNMQLSQPRIGEVPLCPELPIPQSIPIKGICVPLEWIKSSFGPHGGHAKRRESSAVIRIPEDVDFTFPWQVPLICLAMTWALGMLTILCVMYFPVQSVPTIVVSVHVGFVGLIVYLFVRVILLRMNVQTIVWGLSFPFASLEHYSRVAFGLLITTFIIILIVLDIMLFLFWRHDENWRRTQLSIMRTLLRLVSDASRELPGLIVISPLLYLLGLYLIIALCGFIIMHMCAIVEPVRMRSTGCLALQQHAWVQYGLIPVHLMFSMWFVRFYMALCQTATSVLVVMWYNAAASNVNIPPSLYLGTVCQKIRHQAMGSIAFASLLSTFNWFPLQVLTCLRTLIRQEPLDDRHEKEYLQRCWALESLLRQLDCNIYTVMACDQKSFSKSWSHLNTGICEQTVPIKLVELMRWCEVLFTLAKLACTATATLFAFAYFSHKPPIAQMFPFILICALTISYLTASTVIGILQHILSTIMICFCLQEEQRFANEVMNEQVMIGFRHDEIISKLAFLTENKQEETSWPRISHRKFRLPDTRGVFGNRNRTNFPSESDIPRRIEEISV